MFSQNNAGTLQFGTFPIERGLNRASWVQVFAVEEQTAILS
jgi:hypothetical protein